MSPRPGTPGDGQIAAALMPLARILAPLVAEELRGAPAEEWIPHVASPLGARRTRELARSGAFPGAQKVGRKWLVPRVELNAFIARAGSAPPATVEPRAHGTEDDDPEVRAVLAEAGLELTPKPSRSRARRTAP
ncbi:MAG: helix-turn-helix domain-containing protein [Polyangiaceae bacterium]